MRERKRRPWVTSESKRLSFSIACAVRDCRTEKQAIEAICSILQAWDEEILPGELGSKAREAEDLIRFYEKEKLARRTFGPV